MNASKPSIVIIVSGSRHWSNKKAMDTAFRIVFAEFIGPRADKIGEIVLMHGGARGADKMSESSFQEAYEALGQRRIRIRIERRPPDWDTYGKPAGPIRNAEMFSARLMYADHIILHFHDALKGGSKGTKQMYELCTSTNKKKSSKPVRFCHFESKDSADEMTQKVTAAGMESL
jgi:hypothetical protein